MSLQYYLEGEKAMDLIKELKNLILLLDKDKIEYALCGGLALAVYDFPRATLDIDIMIERKSLKNTGILLADAGFIQNPAAMLFADGKVEIHRFFKPFPTVEDGLIVDVLVATRSTRKAFRERIIVKWKKIDLAVVSPQGLILLKSLRKSGQDMDDIAHLGKIDNEN
jgi:hypothetical protein